MVVSNNKTTGGRSNKNMTAGANLQFLKPYEGTKNLTKKVENVMGDIILFAINDNARNYLLNKHYKSVTITDENNKVTKLTSPNIAVHMPYNNRNKFSYKLELKQ